MRPDVVEAEAQTVREALVNGRLQRIVVGDCLIEISAGASTDILIDRVRTELGIVRRQLILRYSVDVRGEGEIEAVTPHVGQRTHEIRTELPLEPEIPLPNLRDRCVVVVETYTLTVEPGRIRGRCAIGQRRARSIDIARSVELYRGVNTIRLIVRGPGGRHRASHACAVVIQAEVIRVKPESAANGGVWPYQPGRAD